jgi:hypothetical protein
MTAADLHRALHERGIRTVLQRGESGGPRVSFLITAEHTPEEIDHAVGMLDGLPATQPTQRRAKHHEHLVASHA